MKIMVTGAAGMLGTEVVRAVGKSPHMLAPLERCELDIGDASEVAEALARYGPDAVINCAGLTPQRKGVTPQEMIRSNALGPQILAAECGALGIRLVHVSTDCVFAGKRVPDSSYIEADPIDPIDFYGWSKAAGEPDNPTTLNVRCSFVAPTGGLVGWLTQQKGAVPGWTCAYWSGLTAVAYARILVELAETAITGVLHVPGERISKFRLLSDVAEAFGLAVEVRPVDTPCINRHLGCARRRFEWWWADGRSGIPSWKWMLADMAELYRG